MTVRSHNKWIATGIIVVGLSVLAWGLWIPVKAVVAQQLLDLAWERSQSGELDVRPWPWADILPAFRISLPGHDTSFVILNNSSGEALAFGPGHVRSSTRHGNAGVVVVGGHRDTHFSILREMKIGDTIIIEDIQGGQFSYSVTEIAVRHKDEIAMKIGEQSHVLILATCFPFDEVVPGGPERFLVIAERSEANS
jgi:sortase A